MSKQSAERSRTERAAALVQEQQRAERKRRFTLVVSIVAALTVIAGIGAFFLLRTDKVANSKAGESEYGLKLGPADAPTKVVIYEDFLCPVCRTFEAMTRDKLQEAIDAGKVQVEYRPFYFLQQFGDYSERASNAFRAVWDQAGPEAAKKFHDSIFEEQPAEEGPFPDDDWLVEKAVAAGATEADIRPAIEDMDYRDWVEKATQEATDIPITGTPSVYVNDKLLSADSLDGVAAQMFIAIG